MWTTFKEMMWRWTRKLTWDYLLLGQEDASCLKAINDFITSDFASMQLCLTFTMKSPATSQLLAVFIKSLITYITYKWMKVLNLKDMMWKCTRKLGLASQLPLIKWCFICCLFCRIRECFMCYETPIRMGCCVTKMLVFVRSKCICSWAANSSHRQETYQVQIYYFPLKPSCIFVVVL